MAKEKSEIDHLLFGVKKVKTVDLIPGYKPLSYNNVAIVDNKNRILNFCSEDYGLVTNSSIISAVQKQFKDMDIEIKGTSSHSNTRFKFDVVFKDYELTKDKKDMIFPKLSIYNSYNGRTRYSFSGGLFRLVCLNGLTVPVGESAKTISSIHTPTAESGLALHQMEEIVSVMLKARDELLEPIELLKDIPIYNPELRVEIIADATGFPKNQVEAVLERINLESKQMELTDWVIYNGFNFQLNHNEEFAMAPDKRMKLDQQIFQYML